MENNKIDYSNINTLSVEKLVETISNLDEALVSETNKNFLLSNEINNLKESINYLNEHIKCQEEIIDENNINKMLMKETQKFKPELSRTYFQSEENNILINRMNYYKKKCDVLNEELKRANLEIKIVSDDIRNKLSVEEHKNFIMSNILKEKDEKISSQMEIIEKLSSINKNYITEISQLNNVISSYENEKELLYLELEFLRSELIVANKIANNSKTQQSFNDENFNKMNLLLKDYQNSMINMEFTNFIFNVTRIGLIVETNAEVRI